MNKLLTRLVTLSVTLILLSQLSQAQCKYREQGRNNFEGYEFKKSGYKNLKSSLTETLQVSIEKRVYKDSVHYILWIWREMLTRNYSNLQVVKKDGELLLALDDQTIISCKPSQDVSERFENNSFTLAAIFEVSLNDIEKLKIHKITDVRLKPSTIVKSTSIVYEVSVKEKFQNTIIELLKCL